MLIKHLTDDEVQQYAVNKSNADRKLKSINY